MLSMPCRHVDCHSVCKHWNSESWQQVKCLFDVSAVEAAGMSTDEFAAVAVEVSVRWRLLKCHLKSKSREACELLVEEYNQCPLMFEGCT